VRTWIQYSSIKYGLYDQRRLPNRVIQYEVSPHASVGAYAKPEPNGKKTTAATNISPAVQHRRQSIPIIGRGSESDE
jgi:hypothetical protein